MRVEGSRCKVDLVHDGADFEEELVVLPDRRGLLLAVLLLRNQVHLGEKGLELRLGELRQARLEVLAPLHRPDVRERELTELVREEGKGVALQELHLPVVPREHLVAREGLARVLVDLEVLSSGCRVQGSGFRVQGSGFRVQGDGLRRGDLVEGEEVEELGEEAAFAARRQRRQPCTHLETGSCLRLLDLASLSLRLNVQGFRVSGRPRPHLVSGFGSTKSALPH